MASDRNRRAANLVFGVVLDLTNATGQAIDTEVQRRARERGYEENRTGAVLRRLCAAGDIEQLPNERTAAEHPEWWRPDRFVVSERNVLAYIERVRAREQAAS